ncbi:MAG: sigma-70 family RNA polymerase sigma factor [Terriglobales bacterium]|jgi:RNA polymerase sigma-70 factor, ECF subfamily
MASRSGERVNLLAAGWGRRCVREQSAPEFAEDAILVSAARDGDRAAFGRLYDRYARMVHGVLLAKAPACEAEDLVQEVFLLALRRLSTLRETGSFGAWLAVIARNLANDYHRRSVPEDRLEDDTSESEIKQGNVRGDHQSPAAILDAVKSLPDAYKETLILRLVEGMTGPEIAARTGLTHGSVRVNLHRGMQQLRAKLSPNASKDRPEKERSEKERPEQAAPLS